MNHTPSSTPISLLPDGWKRGSGYSHAIKDPVSGLVVVAGQFGQDPRTGEFAGDFAGQWRQAMQNIVEIARACGRGPEAIMLLRVFICSLDEYRAAQAEVATAQRDVMGKWFPATTMVEISRLFDPRARLEIEAVLRP